MCVISFMAPHKNMESFKTWTQLGKFKVDDDWIHLRALIYLFCNNPIILIGNVENSCSPCSPVYVSMWALLSLENSICPHTASTAQLIR